jgi:DNA-binding transcriptional ArsR family regulator
MVKRHGDSLSRTFTALVDPTRRAMLTRLASHPNLSVSELARPFPIKLPAILKHLGVLADAGLVTRHKVGRTVQCRLSRRPLGHAARWLERTSSFWNARLDNLTVLVEGKHGRRR